MFVFIQGVVVGVLLTVGSILFALFHAKRTLEPNPKQPTEHKMTRSLFDIDPQSRDGWLNHLIHFLYREFQHSGKILFGLHPQNFKFGATLNPYWQISGEFLRPFYWKTHPIVNWRILGVTQAVLLENSSRPNVTYHIWFQSKNRMDEFSSKTACVTTQKMKISEKFRDEFHDLPIR